MSKMVFLDTNVYLHYQLFDQVNWPKVLKASEVTIVVPPVTVRELNKHKELHPRSRVRERAGTVLRKLFSLFELSSQAHLRDNVEIWLEDRDPMIDFAAFQLNHNVQDDHLIASIIMIQNEKPEAGALLVTSDEGLTLTAKAKRRGIPTATLPDNLRLAEEPDPHQSRIRELEQKVRSLELKLPQISLIFRDGSQYATFVLPHPVELTQEELASKQKWLEQQYPKIEHQTRQTRGLSEHLASVAEAIASFNASLGNTLLPEAIERYNTELEKFYQAYAEYLRMDVWYQNLFAKNQLRVLALMNYMEVKMTKKKSILDFQRMKKEGEKVTWLTAYDYPTAQFEERAGIDMILVGDSMGNCVYGYEGGTVPVTMDQCIVHTEAVRRGSPQHFCDG